MDKLLYKPNSGTYKLLMAYPAIESFALSSLGYMWLYKIADTTEGINAEKCSTDNINLSYLPQSIAFSMSFDFDFMGVFEILEKYNIPFLAKDRNDNYPLIFAGGPVITTNPAPYEEIFDFMMMGDGETTFCEVLEVLKSNSKADALKILENIDGIYIPGKKVTKKTCELNNVIYTPLLSSKSYFKDTFIIEVARGCMNRCAFCSASYLNLPFRFYDVEKIKNVIDFGLEQTSKIALLGAQISAHPDFLQIMDYIEQKIDEGQQIELGISSLRTDAVTPKIVQTLVKGGQKHSTIAIEAASERLRKFINKNLKNEQIFSAVKTSRENGLKGLKIYSMIGIPSETQADIEEFILLAKNLKSQNKGFKLEFSFSTFVPKPNTPFQWCKREDTKSLEQKQRFLEKEFAKLGISTKFSSAKWDYWQSVLSRAGKEITPFLIDVYKNGGNIGSYKAAKKKFNLEFKNSFELDEILPWDCIEINPSKEILKNEYKRLLKYS